MCCINFHLSVILTFNVVLTCSAVLTSTLCRGDMDFTKSKFLCHNWELVISKMVLFLVATPTSTLSVHDLALYSMSDLPWQTWGTRETWRTRDTRGTGYTKMAKRTRATAKRDKTDLASSYLWRAAFTILAMFSLILVKDKILPRQFWRKPLRGWFEGWTRRRESLASWWWPLRWWSILVIIITIIIIISIIIIIIIVIINVAILFVIIICRITFTQASSALGGRAGSSWQSTCDSKCGAKSKWLLNKKHFVLRSCGVWNVIEITFEQFFLRNWSELICRSEGKTPPQV